MTKKTQGAIFSFDIDMILLLAKYGWREIILFSVLWTGIGAGLWKDRGEIEKKIAKGVIFRPKMSAGERASRMEGWRKAVERALL